MGGIMNIDPDRIIIDSIEEPFKIGGQNTNTPSNVTVNFHIVSVNVEDLTNPENIVSVQDAITNLNNSLNSESGIQFMNNVIRNEMFR